ncbi:uncharacterized protein K489DRAFT_82608 [Dissoconium aciculare CBS 342.82]|uniref:Uncharacterized protein n=1 Tax=Dissoconium aciculare CBS 342.82 TaxID=1314786 RepID=A0A6J3LTA9_9PEZI|nr:uncharacterized protein K489DRAFT_82608 [Dissoconium aciculare CBS 342.82]KAF1818888.1 hypothetical protein K489DRAFT_82608 [Dissoconium aciculare CBS 342.82]
MTALQQRVAESALIRPHVQAGSFSHALVVRDSPLATGEVSCTRGRDRTCFPASSHFLFDFPREEGSARVRAWFLVEKGRSDVSGLVVRSTGGRWYKAAPAFRLRFVDEAGVERRVFCVERKTHRWLPLLPRCSLGAVRRILRLTAGNRRMLDRSRGPLWPWRRGLPVEWSGRDDGTARSSRPPSQLKCVGACVLPASTTCS